MTEEQSKAFRNSMAEELKKRLELMRKRQAYFSGIADEYESLEEIAIHEYAHHIHETEKRINENRRKERVHGPQFWRIYSTLMSVAQRRPFY